MTDTEKAFLDSVKQAYAARAELFEREGGYTREEMLAANERILKATKELEMCRARLA